MVYTQNQPLNYVQLVFLGHAVLDAAAWSLVITLYHYIKVSFCLNSRLAGTDNGYIFGHISVYTVHASHRFWAHVSR